MACHPDRHHDQHDQDHHQKIFIGPFSSYSKAASMKRRIVSSSSSSFGVGVEKTYVWSLKSCNLLHLFSFLSTHTEPESCLLFKKEREEDMDRMKCAVARPCQAKVEREGRKKLTFRCAEAEANFVIEWSKYEMGEIEMGLSLISTESECNLSWTEVRLL